MLIFGSLTNFGKQNKASYDKSGQIKPWDTESQNPKCILQNSWFQAFVQTSAIYNLVQKHSLQTNLFIVNSKFI